MLFAYRNWTRRPQLADYPPQPSGTAVTAGPLVSVIVPARDEAANIEPCVRSILAATYEPLELIVVEDRSSDGTAEIVERLAAAPEAAGRPRLVRGAELPAGWFGKQWALVQGYRAARGELLLFADADTRHHPELVARAVRALDTEHAALLSVVSRQEMATFWERLIQPRYSSPSPRGSGTCGASTAPASNGRRSQTASSFSRRAPPTPPSAPTRPCARAWSRTWRWPRHRYDTISTSS